MPATPTADHHLHVRKPSARGHTQKKRTGAQASDGRFLLPHHLLHVHFQARHLNALRGKRWGERKGARARESLHHVLDLGSMITGTVAVTTTVTATVILRARASPALDLGAHYLHSLK